jgi:hypothetical protein
MVSQHARYVEVFNHYCAVVLGKQSREFVQRIFADVGYFSVQPSNLDLGLFPSPLPSPKGRRVEDEGNSFLDSATPKSGHFSPFLVREG